MKNPKSEMFSSFVEKISDIILAKFKNTFSQCNAQIQKFRVDDTIPFSTNFTRINEELFKLILWLPLLKFFSFQFVKCDVKYRKVPNFFLIASHPTNRKKKQGTKMKIDARVSVHSMRWKAGWKCSNAHSHCAT